MLSPARVLAISGKELRHLRRDRLTAGMIAGIPLIMSLLFGYAINQDVRHLHAVVVDDANSRLSHALIRDLEATQVLDIQGFERSIAAVEGRLTRGEVSIGIVVPGDLERRRRRHEPLAQLLVDGSDPLVLSAARGLLNMPWPRRYGATTRQSVFALRAYYNPERRSAVFIVPGLCGVILALTMVLFTSVALVRERERGNLELLIATPVGSLELMIGKILPYIAIGYIQVTLILALALVLFDVPVVGSLADFYAGAGIFVISVLTLGLVISTLAQSQFQAFQMTFVSFLPQLLLSGYMFPFEGMPRAAQWLAELFPLTHFLRVVRGIILRGADLYDMRGDLWPLAAFFLLGLTVAVVRFRKRLD